MNDGNAVLALDIGGANLKAAHSDGAARIVPFALWKNRSGLAAALAMLLQGWPAFSSLAITMTGELCDCFETKRQGVLEILDAVDAVADLPVQVWRTDGTLVDLTTARTEPLLAAAANWLALATFAGRFAPQGPALVLDIGSTTTDIVPLLDGKPIPNGRTDFERSRLQELVYLGARRTPLCALMGTRGPAELFATTQDVMLALGLQPEDPTSFDTADGRPATRIAAHARLARMTFGDLETTSEEQRHALARELLEMLLQRLARAVEAVSRRLPCLPSAAVLSGSGEALGPMVLERAAGCPAQLISLKDRIGVTASAAACAYGLAVLALERDEGSREEGKRGRGEEERRA